MNLLAPTQLAEAIRWACIAELDALKPGNVGRHADGHGMQIQDFLLSAEAVSPVLARPGLGVGERILLAIRATRSVVDCNTNLGIVLLCAPLAHAALHRRPRQTLRHALSETLAGLGVDDAMLAYEAIRLAAPAGLGSVAEGDVAESSPDIDLLQAMRLAAGRDRIAAQYSSQYADVFERALPRYSTALFRCGSRQWAVVATYLDLLAGMPDTHIERKHGHDTAQQVSAAAARLAQVLNRHGPSEQLRDRLLQFDTELKGRGINPGASADLTVATLMVKRLEAYGETAGMTSMRGTGNGLTRCSLTAFSKAT